ncbi:C45 family autoproteolytic acyltransferase/hydolase [Limnohabitans sp.]|jgi:isopenicillin-N N-acyltransferase-like protein|uniref:C45 family autoproteolytic acyltransferase/hydolase n=1 Tax=Limnohabitans sp. TaxID=1907725 RepID=UPI0037BFB42F
MFPCIDTLHATSAHERGQIYGQEAKARIQHSVVTYARLFAACGIDWASACERAMRFEPVIEQVDADLMAELRGMAQGSGQSLGSLMALNCRTEILPATFFSDEPQLAHAALAANRAAGLPDWLADAPWDGALQDGECTAMGVTAAASRTGQAWLAQNWDWMGRQRQALVLLHTQGPSGQSITTLTEAGMLAKIGINQSGFALGLNILRSVRDGSRLGVPVHVLLRHLLDCRSVAHARERLNSLQTDLGLGFGAASNVPCADAQGQAVCFEVSPAGWAEVSPTDGVVVHTNHFVCAPLLAEQAPVGPGLSSHSRLSTASQHALQRPIGQAELERFLRDESDGFLSICRSPDPSVPPESRVESVAGIVMHTQPPAMWVACDVPSRVAFEVVPLARKTVPA